MTYRLYQNKNNIVFSCVSRKSFNIQAGLKNDLKNIYFINSNFTFLHTNMDIDKCHRYIIENLYINYKLMTIYVCGD